MFVHVPSGHNVLGGLFKILNSPFIILALRNTDCMESKNWIQQQNML